MDARCLLELFHVGILQALTVRITCTPHACSICIQLAPVLAPLLTMLKNTVRQHHLHVNNVGLPFKDFTTHLPHAQQWYGPFSWRPLSWPQEQLCVTGPYGASKNMGGTS